MYDCVPSLKEFIDNLLKNDNVLQLWVGKNQPISLYSKTTKHEDIFYKENARKKCKANKTIFISYANTYKVDVLSSINPELQIKILNLQL